MTLTALLFDKDGTLIDFNQTWLTAYVDATNLLAAHCNNAISANELLKHGGYDLTTQQWQADSILAAGSNEQILKHWEQLTGIDIEGDLLAQISGIFNKCGDNICPIVPDLVGILKRLHRDGYHLGLATMDDQQQAVNTLDALGVQHLFRFVCGADSGLGVKPEAGMSIAFASRCKIALHHVAVVGDSPRDLNMARNAGAGYAIGVLSGASSAADLTPHADYVIDSVAQLPDLLHEIQSHSLPTDSSRE